MCRQKQPILFDREYMSDSEAFAKRIASDKDPKSTAARWVSPIRWMRRCIENVLEHVPDKRAVSIDIRIDQELPVTLSVIVGARRAVAYLDHTTLVKNKKQGTPLKAIYLIEKAGSTRERP